MNGYCTFLLQQPQTPDTLGSLSVHTIYEGRWPAELVPSKNISVLKGKLGKVHLSVDGSNEICSDFELAFSKNK